ncbi:Inositol-pentakisphosphate 2-kinase, variant 3 [Trebouxia sp. C0010 RCD-2024]
MSLVIGTAVDVTQDVSQHFASVLLNDKHLLYGVQVQVPAQLLASLSDQLCSSSSCSSLSTNQRQLLSPAACLLPDCTLFPPSHSALRATPDVERHYNTSSSSAPGSAVEPVLCVEIKPKWGLLPTSPAISAEHEVKRHKSRFQLHQKLKLAQGKIQNSSAYDPLDLFSTDPTRMQRALRALFACPQNNLKLFLNGQPVQLSDNVSSVHQVAAVVQQTLNPCLHLTDTIKALELLASLLQEVLSTTGVLQKLLSIQALDEHDIAGVYPLYRHVVQQLESSSTTDAEASLVAAEHMHISALQPHDTYIQQLLDLGWSQQMKILQNYLLATTAKDCSLMIALQAAQQVYLPHVLEGSGTQLHDNGSPWQIVRGPIPMSRFKLTVVDLDRKHHAKIVAHHRLDQELVFHANQGRAY